MLHAPDKARFRKEHAEEIAAFEEARRYLKQANPDGKLLDLKALKARKLQLQELINEQKSLVQELGNHEKELAIAAENVDAMLDLQPVQELEVQRKGQAEELA